MPRPHHSHFDVFAPAHFAEEEGFRDSFVQLIRLMGKSFSVGNHTYSNERNCNLGPDAVYVQGLHCI